MAENMQHHDHDRGREPNVLRRSIEITAGSRHSAHDPLDLSRPGKW